jgi:pyruvate/2-oxoglutarate dehydrogenase complex dihydrolipoamide acyltransferase (E2) component
VANTPTEVTVSFWPVAVGATLQEGDDLLEIVTDKASFVVPCPQAGVLREKRVQEDDRISTGDVIAVIEVES